jgi:phosphatidylglycerophosphatase A
MFHKIKKLPGEFFSTSFYIGNIKFAPGTFGSLVGLFFSFILLKIFSFSIINFFFITILLSIAGYISTIIYLKAKNAENEDPKEVVIDEVSGQMISFLVFFSFFTNSDIDSILKNFTVYLMNFVLFRFFDISKIFPVSYFDNKDGAFYVMMDDIVAGFMSGLLSIIIFFFLKNYI